MDERRQPYSIIHPWAIRDSTTDGIGGPLRQTDLQRGAKLVWSPLSNLLLYGKTTDIPAALAANVLVCLGADWSPSGSKDMLAEIKVAHEYDKAKWGHRLSDIELVKMVTISPAVRWAGTTRWGESEPATMQTSPYSKR